MLTARAMSEGTTERDAVAFVEAAERLGAEMGAGASWDSLSVHVEVPRTHLTEAMSLFAEMALQPAFPERDVDRLRDERLNDLQQVMADRSPTRREGLPGSGLRPRLPPTLDRLAASRRPSVALDRDVLAARHASLMRPEACTLIVCGDIDGPRRSRQAGRCLRWLESLTMPARLHRKRRTRPLPAGAWCWSIGRAHRSRRSASVTWARPGASRISMPCR